MLCYGLRGGFFLLLLLLYMYSSEIKSIFESFRRFTMYIPNIVATKGYVHRGANKAFKDTFLICQL
jgi:hypothetical protein